MKLIDWLRDTENDIHSAAEAFGVSIYAVRKWIRGERTPRPKMQAKIKRVTRGQVTGNDWVPSSSSD